MRFQTGVQMRSEIIDQKLLTFHFGDAVAANEQVVISYFRTGLNGVQMDIVEPVLAVEALQHVQLL